MLGVTAVPLVPCVGHSTCQGSILKELAIELSCPEGVRVRVRVCVCAHAPVQDILFINISSTQLPETSLPGLYVAPKHILFAISWSLGTPISGSSAGSQACGGGGVSICVCFVFVYVCVSVHVCVCLGGVVCVCLCV